MAPNHGHGSPPRRGGRRKLWNEKVNLTLPRGAKARMDALLAEDEDRLDLIRAAIETEVRRRESAVSPERARAADAAPSWPWGSYGLPISSTGRMIEMRLTPPVEPAAITREPDPGVTSPARASATTAPMKKSKQPSKFRSSRSSDPLHNRWTKMRADGRVPAWDVFEEFLKDIGSEFPDPPGSMLLRRDPGQPWGPTNVFWGTAAERANASSRCRRHVYDGREWTQKQLADRFGIGRSTLAARLKKGMPLEEALTAEVRWGPGHPKYR